MRSLPLLALLALPVVAAAAAGAGRLELERVWPGYRTAASFSRISEYFTGVENPGRSIVRRSQPDSREGYYFLVRLDNPGKPIAKATFRIGVIGVSAPATRTFAFQADVPAGTDVFELGLTGRDWQLVKDGVVAWQLTVQGPDGAELAHQQSFLWSQPGDSAP